MPTLAADYFGQKHIGANYGLLFTAWGAAGFIVPGYLSAVIEAAFRSVGGDPIAYRIRGALIALRREQAEWVRVEVLTDEPVENGRPTEVGPSAGAYSSGGDGRSANSALPEEVA